MTDRIHSDAAEIRAISRDRIRELEEQLAYANKMMEVTFEAGRTQILHLENEKTVLQSLLYRAIEVVKHVYSEGHGREFYPTQLNGDRNPFFDKARSLLQ